MLKEKIQKDLTEAAKKKEKLKISVLRFLLARILNKEKEKRYRLSKEKPHLKGEELEKESQLEDEEVIEVISSEIKKRKEAILEGERAGRKEWVEKEKREIEILKEYLPKPLSREEIERLAREIIEKLGVKEVKEMGRVMAELMPKVKGRAEGKVVSEIVRELLISKN